MKPNPLPTPESEIDHYSEQGDILGKAYDYGHHNLLDGCLVPLLEQLNALITREVTAARREELENVASNLRGYQNWVYGLDYINTRLAELNQEKEQ